jgi:hypothetical protein
MSSLKSSRITLRLLKLASLGLAGLLAGLLVGCAAAPKTTATNSYDVQTQSIEPLNSSYSTLPPSLDATSIPGIKHPPSARRLEYGSVHISHSQSPSHGY